MDVTELEYVDGLRIMYQDAFNSQKNGGLNEIGCPSELFVSFNRSETYLFSDLDVPVEHYAGEYSYDSTLGYWVGVENQGVGIWHQALKKFGDILIRDSIELNWCVGIVDTFGSWKVYTCNIYNPSNTTCPHSVANNWAFLEEAYYHQQMAPSTFCVKINGGKTFKRYLIKTYLKISQLIFQFLCLLNFRFILFRTTTEFWQFCNKHFPSTTNKTSRVSKSCL